MIAIQEEQVNQEEEIIRDFCERLISEDELEQRLIVALGPLSDDELNSLIAAAHIEREEWDAANSQFGVGA